MTKKHSIFFLFLLGVLILLYWYIYDKMYYWSNKRYEQLVEIRINERKNKPQKPLPPGVDGPDPGSLVEAMKSFYQDLRNTCHDGPVYLRPCCLASVDKMEKESFYIPFGGCKNSSVAREGSLVCPGSYVWCEKIK